MRQLCRVGDFISARIESIVCSILGRPASQKNQISVRLAEARSGVKSRSHRGPRSEAPERPRVPNLTCPTRVIIGPRFKRAKIPSYSPLAGAHEAKKYALSRRGELTPKAAHARPIVHHPTLKTHPPLFSDPLNYPTI